MHEDATWEVVSESPPLRLVLSPGAARIIGRNGERGADFLIAHVTVARRHAALGNRGGVLEVED
ncbi:MAG TPA: hypothetical protein VFS00_09180, partial [Polyangiaceae bacterium]|nr:hypothetical protein [Polyangiaceae bacterium]